mmetsp:Transcript_121847/g.339491  ORF Transcript_121847/g.339491 Transcript_121847/m.339491 type:complete len:221 (+) Transcript_121847:39-701(+)
MRLRPAGGELCRAWHPGGRLPTGHRRRGGIDVAGPHAAVIQTRRAAGLAIQPARTGALPGQPAAGARRFVGVDEQALRPHARGPGRFRRAQPSARHRGFAGWPSPRPTGATERRPSRPRQPARHCRRRRACRPEPREDGHAQARVCRRRCHHGRQLVADQRWRRRAADRQPRLCQAAWPEAARALRQHRRGGSRPGDPVHRCSRCHPQGADGIGSDPGRH